MELLWIMLEAIGTLVLAAVAAAAFRLLRRRARRETDSRYRPFPVVTRCVFHPAERYRRYRHGCEAPEGADWPELSEQELRELKETRGTVTFSNFRGKSCVIVNALPADHDLSGIVFDFALAEATLVNYGYPLCEIELLAEEAEFAGKNPERIAGSCSRVFSMLQTGEEQTFLLCLLSDRAAERAPAGLTEESAGRDCLAEAEMPRLKGRLPYVRVGIQARFRTLLGDSYDYTLSLEQQGGFLMARTREMERDSPVKKLRRKIKAFIQTK